MTNNKDNFLHKIPKRNNKISHKENKDGNITLIIPRDKWIEKFIRRFYKISEQFTVDLDKFGSEVWKAIDGNHNIYHMGQRLKDIFGEEIEPLYPRLVTFIKTLKNNHFIEIQ